MTITFPQISSLVFIFSSDETIRLQVTVNNSVYVQKPESAGGNEAGRVGSTEVAPNQKHERASLHFHLQCL